MSAIFVYVTCPNIKEARNIGRVMVEERLAACANVFVGMESIYRWQNKIEETKETVLILKSKRLLFEEIKERIMAIHSYENPCIVEWQIEDGAPKYLEWIHTETKAI